MTTSSSECQQLLAHHFHHLSLGARDGVILAPWSLTVEAAGGRHRRACSCVAAGTNGSFRSRRSRWGGRRARIFDTFFILVGILIFIFTIAIRVVVVRIILQVSCCCSQADNAWGSVMVAVLNDCSLYFAVRYALRGLVNHFPRHTHLQQLDVCVELRLFCGGLAEGDHDLLLALPADRPLATYGCHHFVKLHQLPSRRHDALQPLNLVLELVHFPEVRILEECVNHRLAVEASHLQSPLWCSNYKGGTSKDWW